MRKRGCTCEGFGYRFGGADGTPQLVPCVCNGGPKTPWYSDRPRAEPAAAPAPQAPTTPPRRDLKGGV